MSVKRYDPSLGEGLTESRGGAYVLHSDFAALAAENEGLRDSVIVLRDALREMIDHCDKCGVVSSPAFENAKRIAIREALSRKAAP